jgi:hypothetical protein
MARRDDREYPEYLREEQRRQPGCPARRPLPSQRRQATSMAQHHRTERAIVSAWRVSRARSAAYGISPSSAGRYFSCCWPGDRPEGRTRRRRRRRAIRETHGTSIVPWSRKPCPVRSSGSGGIPEITRRLLMRGSSLSDRHGQAESGYHAAGFRRSTHWLSPLNPSHDTAGFQFEKVPAGLSFQAQTCSV